MKSLMSRISESLRSPKNRKFVFNHTGSVELTEDIKVQRLRGRPY